MHSVYPLQILSRVFLVYKHCGRKAVGAFGDNKTLADADARNYIAGKRIFTAYNSRRLMRMSEQFLLPLTRDTCTLFTETSRGQRV